MASRKDRNQLHLKEKIWLYERVYMSRGPKAREDEMHLGTDIGRVHRDP